MLAKDSPLEEEKVHLKTNNMFRDHFQFIEKKKEMAASHNELPPVNEGNKKMIADNFNSKRRYRGNDIF